MTYKGVEFRTLSTWVWKNTYQSNTKQIFLSRKMNAIYEDRLRKAVKPEETAWLYHELSRFSIELRKFEMARVYARKCIQEARKCNNPRWIINAMLLITKVNMLQHNRNDAKNEVRSAIAFAETMNDEGLVKYLTKVIQNWLL